MADKLDRTTTRSDTFTRTLLDTVYKEQNELPNSAKLPDGRSVMGHMIKLTKKAKKGERQISVNEGSTILAAELCDKWIKKNVYPNQERHVAKKIKNDYEHFKNLCNQLGSKKTKKSQKWHKRATDFNTSMTKNAYDIRTKSQEWQKKLEDMYGVKMTQEDELYYIDNCHGSYSATCPSSASSKWTRKKNREDKRHQSVERKREQQQNRKKETTQKKLEYDNALSGSSDHESQSPQDPTFESPLPSCSTYLEDFFINTRSSVPSSTPENECRSSQESQTNFPKVIAFNTSFYRFSGSNSQKDINEQIIRCTVQCLADYKVSPSDLSGIIVNTANIFFGHEWDLPEETSGERNVDNESDDEETAEPIAGTSKRRMEET